MKRILILFSFILTSSSVLLAQGVRINLYSAYVFEDHIEAYYNDYDYYSGSVNGGYQWGAGVEFFCKTGLRN